MSKTKHEWIGALTPIERSLHHVHEDVVIILDEYNVSGEPDRNADGEKYTELADELRELADQLDELAKVR